MRSGGASILQEGAEVTDRDVESSMQTSPDPSPGTSPRPSSVTCAETSPVTIRPAIDGDVDAVARIWHAGWVDGHLGRVPDALVEHRRDLEPLVARQGWRDCGPIQSDAQTATGAVIVPAHRYERDLRR